MTRIGKQRLRNAKGRTSSSTDWLYRHINDKYVHLAKKEGYRSRAAFKLLEIEKKFNIFAKKPKCILDIGAAPGSWLQVARIHAPRAVLIGIDLLAIGYIENAYLIQGDFTSSIIQNQILFYAFNGVDLILSDMAANASGDKQLDHLRSSTLVESVLGFTACNLNIGGALMVKLIRGRCEQILLKSMRSLFQTVKLFKPDASYSDSSEIYIIAYDKYNNVLARDGYGTI